MLHLHPLLHLAVRRPQLLLDHAAAYAELAAAEAATAAAQWERRVAWRLAAAIAFGVAALLAGVALLLWAALPPGSIARPGWMLATPLPPLLLAMVAVRRAARAGAAPNFAQLRRQAASDLLLLRDAPLEPAP